MGISRADLRMHRGRRGAEDKNCLRKPRAGERYCIEEGLAAYCSRLHLKEYLAYCRAKADDTENIFLLDYAEHTSP